LYDIAVARIYGKPASLADYRGKVLLVVNVASECGLTPQYEGLQNLYAEKRARGLEILGFPANNFGAQEPGSNAEIAAFCDTRFGVEFPMFSKISVVGTDRHPLYDALVKAQPAAVGAEAMRKSLAGYGITPASDTDVMWNFEKFVIGRDGTVIARFAPDVTPEDAGLNKVLDAALAG
ncbi:MAG: glutathione peroxidase, partial [Dongia sp.]